MRSLLVALLLLATPALADGLSGGAVATGGDVGPTGTITSIQGTAVTGTTGSGNVVFATGSTLAGTTVLNAASVTNSITANGFVVNGAAVVANGINRPAANQLGLYANTALQAIVTSTSGTFLQQMAAPSLTQTSVAQTGTLCWQTGTGQFTVDTTVACLASLEELKNIKGPITNALGEVMALRPFWFTWKDSPDKAEQPGLGAHATAAVDPRLAGYDSEGNLHGVRYQELTAVLVAAIQEQQKQIDELKHGFWYGLLHAIGF